MERQVIPTEEKLNPYRQARITFSGQLERGEYSIPLRALPWGMLKGLVKDTALGQREMTEALADVWTLHNINPESLARELDLDKLSKEVGTPVARLHGARDLLVFIGEINDSRNNKLRSASWR